MNVFKFSIMAAAITLTVSLSSCSGNDEPKYDDPVKSEINLTNSTWSSVDSSIHDLQTVFADKQETNETVLSIVQQLTGLNRTLEEKCDTVDVSVNLCEKSGHDLDGVMTLSFTSDKCQINATTSISRYSAQRITTERMYKFEEGSFVINVGGSNYMGVNVYSYGIYWSTGALALPLDGNGCVTFETITKYENKNVEVEDEQSISVSADYSVSGNSVSFSYADNSTTFTGKLDDDATEIVLNNNPFIENLVKFEREY